jgi:hypothetical protein
MEPASLCQEQGLINAVQKPSATTKYVTTLLTSVLPLTDQEKTTVPTTACSVPKDKCEIAVNAGNKPATAKESGGLVKTKECASPEKLKTAPAEGNKPALIANGTSHARTILYVKTESANVRLLQETTNAAETATANTWIATQLPESASYLSAKAQINVNPLTTA